MSSLFNRYRPATWEDVVGQSQAVEQVLSYISRPDSPYSFPGVLLLHGPTGTGKTTICRLIQQSLKVPDYDFLECNAGDDRGIEFVRKLREMANVRPMGGGVRMILLDEAHRLTPDAMEALLKPTESTRAYTKWVFCTTEPEKLKQTLRDRMSQVALQPISARLISPLLEKIALNEGVDLSANAAKQIAEAADGSARRAIGFLETVLASPSISIDEAVSQVLGTGSVTALAPLFFATTVLNWAKFAEALKAIQPTDVESVRRGVLGYARQILLSNPPSTPRGARAMMVLSRFRYDFFASGAPGLALATAEVWNLAQRNECATS